MQSHFYIFRHDSLENPGQFIQCISTEAEAIARAEELAATTGATYTVFWDTVDGVNSGQIGAPIVNPYHNPADDQRIWIEIPSI